jgi:hypothetical protein
MGRVTGFDTNQSRFKPGKQGQDLGTPQLPFQDRSPNWTLLLTTSGKCFEQSYGYPAGLPDGGLRSVCER